MLMIAQDDGLGVGEIRRVEADRERVGALRTAHSTAAAGRDGCVGCIGERKYATRTAGRGGERGKMRKERSDKGVGRERAWSHCGLRRVQFSRLLACVW